MKHLETSTITHQVLGIATLFAGHLTTLSSANKPYSRCPPSLHALKD